jgi:hypothetical protein
MNQPRRQKTKRPEKGRKRSLKVKKLVTICAVVTMLLAVSSGASATLVDLSTLPNDPINGRQEYTQVFVGSTSPYDWTRIAFDYNFQNVGNHVPSPTASEIQIKGYIDTGDGGGVYGHWMMEMRFDSTGTTFTVDTDYGPYIYTAATTGGLIGSHSYEFMLNRSNGLWTMALGGVGQTFLATSATENPQPDGTAVTSGSAVANKYFSDESVTSGQNAIGLGWATWNGSNLVGNASEGVGGFGDWKLYFAEATGNSVDNITMAAVPEPVTMAGMLLGLGALGRYMRRRTA